MTFGDGGSGVGPAMALPSGTDPTGLVYDCNKFTVQHTYASDGPFNASWTSSARIGNLVNAANGAEKFGSVVNLANGNSGSPVSGLPALVQMQRGIVNTIPIPVSQPDSHPMTCRISTPQESLVNSNPTAGGFPLTVTSDCNLVWNTASTSNGQLWSAQFTVTDTVTNATTAVDFIIAIVQATQTQHPPACTGSTGPHTVSVGQAFVGNFTGTDADGGNLVVTIQGAPAGSTLTPASGTSGAQPLASTFAWTPTPAQAGTSFAVNVIYTDPTNLNALCSFSLTVPAANIPPTARCKNVTVNADASCQASASVENGSSDPDDAFSCVQTPAAPYSLGPNVVVNTCTDSTNLSSSCTGTVTVVDVTPPSLVCPPAVVANADATCRATPSLGTPTSGDNCGAPNLANNATPPFGLGGSTVVWTATDGSKNVTTCSQSVTVVDVTPPTITCQANIVAYPSDPGVCGAIISPLALMAGGADNCFTLTPAQTGVPAGSLFPAGTITSVANTVIDGAGLAASCVQTVQVVDVEPPAINCPADITTHPDPHTCTALVNIGSAKTSDNCSVASVTNDAPANATYQKGLTVVTWTVLDAAGNRASCIQTVNVVPRAPVALCLAPTISADGMCLGYTSVDNMSFAPDNNLVGCTQTAGPYHLGGNAVTLACTDLCGDTTSCMTTVTIVDTTPPVIQCPANETLECIDNGAIATFMPSATDNCSVGSLTCAPPSGTKFPLGLGNRDTCTAVDGSDNQTSCGFVINVVDTTPPVVTTKDVTIYEDVKVAGDHGDHGDHSDAEGCTNPTHTFALSDCVTSIVDQCAGPLTVASSGSITRVEWWTYIEAQDATNAHKVSEAFEKAREKFREAGCGDYKISADGKSVDLPVEELDDLSDDAGSYYLVYFNVTDKAGNVSPASCKVNIAGEPPVVGDHGDHGDVHGGHGEIVVPLGCTACTGTGCGLCMSVPAACYPEHKGGRCADQAASCTNAPTSKACGKYKKDCLGLDCK